MLAKSEITIDHRGLDGRKFCGSQPFLAQKPVNRASFNLGKKHSFCVHPAIALGSAGADENGSRSAQRKQFMRVYGQIFFCERAVVFQEIPCHPVILAGSGNVADLLAEVAPEEFGSGSPDELM